MAGGGRKKRAGGILRRPTFTATQLGIIRAAKAAGAGYREIPRARPGHGLTAPGAKEVLKKTAKNGGETERGTGPGRPRTKRSKAAINKVLLLSSQGARPGIARRQGGENRPRGDAPHLKARLEEEAL